MPQSIISKFIAKVQIGRNQCKVFKLFLNDEAIEKCVT